MPNILDASRSALAGVQRLKFMAAVMSEDPIHPITVDYLLRKQVFPNVHDPTGKFIRPRISAVPAPGVDFFALSPELRGLPQLIPSKRLFCNGKPAAISEKRSSTRAVFRYGRFIVKVGYECLLELRLSERILPEDQEHFLPIIAYGRVKDDPFYRTWVAQPMIGVTQARFKYTSDEWRRGHETIIAMCQKYGLDDLALDVEEDGLHPHNWTLRKGVPVIYDYGGVDRATAAAFRQSEKV